MLAAVVTQGLLGGLTVLYFLPPPISIGHAGLAQIFFMLVVSLGGFHVARLAEHDTTGMRSRRREPIVSDAPLRWLAVVTPTVVYLQILVGATMRHTECRVGDPRLPARVRSASSRPSWDPRIAVHFAHRVGAIVSSSCWWLR